jgi:hypothetical protein
MALVLPTAETPSLAHAAQAVLDATDLGALVVALDQTGVVSGCAVSTPGSGGTYTVAVAAGVIESSGVYQKVAAVTNLAIPTASTNDRRDIVVCSASGTVSIVQGTACGVVNWTTTSGVLPPVKPAVPAGSVLLAELYIVGGATAITSAEIYDKTCIIPPAESVGVYGDGSDGAFVLDGSTTVAAPFGAPVLGCYSLTRDAYCTNITMSGAFTTISTAGYRLFVSGTISGTGTIQNGTAFGQSQGVGQAAGTLTATESGVGGGVGAANGSNSANQTNDLGGRGGSGGTGNSGGQTGGTAGTVTAPTAVMGSIRALPWAALGGLLGAGSGFTPANGGTGGGGGGGGGAGGGSGGSGGCAGGVVVVAARYIASTISLNANGGPGLNGTATGTGNAGGGGGGGGGLLIVISSTPTAPTTSATGGAGGAKTGTGVAGNPGAAGTVVLIQS